MLFEGSQAVAKPWFGGFLCSEETVNSGKNLDNSTKIDYNVVMQLWLIIFFDNNGMRRMIWI